MSESYGLAETPPLTEKFHKKAATFRLLASLIKGLNRDVQFAKNVPPSVPGPRWRIDGAIWEHQQLCGSKNTRNEMAYKVLES